MIDFFRLKRHKPESALTPEMLSAAFKAGRQCGKHTFNVTQGQAVTANPWLLVETHQAYEIDREELDEQTRREILAAGFAVIDIDGRTPTVTVVPRTGFEPTTGPLVAELDPRVTELPPTWPDWSTADLPSTVLISYDRGQPDNSHG